MNDKLKKIIVFVIVEVAVLIAVIFCFNMAVFGLPSFRLTTLLFLLHLGFLSGWSAIPMTVLLYFVLFVALIVIQFVFTYQIIHKMIISSRNKNTMSQGSARWAKDSELKFHDMFRSPAEGVVLGQSADARGKAVPSNKVFEITTFGEHLISDDSSYHVLVTGATGSGKGVGVIMPTLFTWKESVIIVDPKGESYDITGGFRSSFSNVYYFNPMDYSGKSCHINPLDYIPRDRSAVTEIGNMVMMIHPNQSKEAYWDKIPRMMLEMIIGHVILRQNKEPSFRASLPMAADILFAEKPYSEIFGDIIAFYDGGNRLSEDDPLFSLQKMVLSNANIFSEMAEGQNAEQLVTHITTVKSDLDVYTRASVALGSSDFSLQDISDGERPISLFLCTPVNQLDQTMPMFKLVYSLILKSLLGTEQKHKHKLLLLLDEFSQFKKFELIAEQIPFVRSFGIRIMAFIQSTGQLQEYYGHDGTKALMDNFQMKLYLRADDNDTCMYFENLLGKKTYLKRSVSISSKKSSSKVDGTSESQSEVGRSLLTADEIRHLPSWEMLLFRPDLHPYRGKKLQYFDDPRFKDQIRLPIQKPLLEPFTLPLENDSMSLFPTRLTKEELDRALRFTASGEKPECETSDMDAQLAAFDVSMEANEDTENGPGLSVTQKEKEASGDVDLT